MQIRQPFVNICKQTVVSKTRNSGDPRPEVVRGARDAPADFQVRHEAPEVVDRPDVRSCRIPSRQYLHGTSKEILPTWTVTTVGSMGVCAKTAPVQRISPGSTRVRSEEAL